jgi:hypothetical protein
MYLKGFHRNCYLHCTQAVFDAVRYNQWDHKCFIYDRHVNIAFPAWQEQGRRESTLNE